MGLRRWRHQDAPWSMNIALSVRGAKLLRGPAAWMGLGGVMFPEWAWRGDPKVGGVPQAVTIAVNGVSARLCGTVSGRLEERE